MKSNFWRNSVGLEPGDNWKQEWAAGILSYFASVYIVMVNAAILHDAGMPLRAGMVATLLTAILRLSAYGLRRQDTDYRRAGNGH